MPTVAIFGTRGYPSYYGGFETAVRRIAPYLADQGWDVTVYGRGDAKVLNDPQRDPRVKRVDTWGIDKKTLSTLTYGWSSVRHAVREQPDVALVMNVANGYWLPMLRHAGIPSLVNVDGIEWDRAKWGKIAKTVFRNGAKWTAKYGTELVYDAEAIARRWNTDFGTDGVFIPYGGDVIAESLPLEPGLTHRGYVLMVARLVPENTVAEFFRAAVELAKQTDVVIVGTTGYGGELDAEASRITAENQRITWLGHVSDDQRLHSLWQHAGVYFHGHSVGGTNPALVQAMAAGAPIVARSTIYNREVIGDEGIFVESDATEIAAKILATLNDQQILEKSSTENIVRAQERYSWLSICAKYEKSLRGLITSSS